MKHVVYVFYKYPSFVGQGMVYRGSYSARTKLGAYLKAFWDTKFEWQFYNYYLDT